MKPGSMAWRYKQGICQGGRGSEQRVPRVRPCLTGHTLEPNILNPSSRAFTPCADGRAAGRPVRRHEGVKAGEPGGGGQAKRAHCRRQHLVQLRHLRRPQRRGLRCARPLRLKLDNFNSRACNCHREARSSGPCTPLFLYVLYVLFNPPRVAQTGTPLERRGTTLAERRPQAG